MSTRAKVSIALGLFLVAISLSAMMLCAYEKSRAVRSAGENFNSLKEVIPESSLEDFSLYTDLTDESIQSVNTNLDNHKMSYVFVDSDPPGARIFPRLTSTPERFPVRTPSFVSDLVTEVILSTDFHYGVFALSEAKGKRVELKVKTHIKLLYFLTLPGLVLLAWGVLEARKPAPSFIESKGVVRPSTVKDRGSSLDTVIRSAPPLPPENGLFEHQPTTPESHRYGRFVKGDKVGEGNMGEVFRCTSCVPGDKNTYALKVLLPQWSQAKDFRTRFEREADICRRLEHPNLVRAYDYGEKDGLLWMVMDFVEGEELDAWLKRQGHSQEALISLFASVCKGLFHAHNVGVIHRDLKPGNILLRKDTGEPVIADFGLAKGKHYDTITETNTTLGTPTYMAPEQITGGHGSARSDLYSLGTMMYEALTGEPPFPEKDVMKLLSQKLLEEAPEIPDNVGNERLRAVVKRLLSKSPDARYSSAAEVLEALSEL